MTKRDFLEAIIIRCSSVPGAKPYYVVRHALECWEALEQYGGGTSAAMPVENAQGLTGPRNPGFS
jgi:hypothetical protein